LFRDGEDDIFDGSALEDTAASDTADTSDEISEAVDFDDINDNANGKALFRSLNGPISNIDKFTDLPMS
jgi:hypothetical protein